MNQKLLATGDGKSLLLPRPLFTSGLIPAFALLLLILAPATTSQAQTDVAVCGTFEMDPLGMCLVFYPDDPAIGDIAADLGALPMPPAGSYGLLSGTAWDCVGICFPTLCISGGTFDPIGCNPASGPEFIRGDCNNDISFNVADVIYHLTSLFASGPPPACRDACDMDLSGNDDIGDSIQMLNVLFQAAPDPPAPFPDCGPADPGGPIPDCQNPICP